MKKRLLPFVLLLTFSSTVLAQVWSPKAIGVLPANYGVDDISIVNDQVIWATTNDYSVSTPVPLAHVSKLIKSTDGGETWTVVDIEEAKGRFCWDIHAFDENTACITTTNRGSGNKRGIFRTTDGGTTWVEVFNHPSGDLWLHFFDSQEGVCGSGEDIARTTDGGATWTAVPAVNVPNLLPGEFIGGSSLSNGIGTSGHSIWFGTSKGRVFKTENRGQNWAAYTTGLGANSFLYSFGFIDEKNGLGVFEVAGVAELARTTDGGKSWTKTGNFNFTVVDAIPCANTFMGASYNAGSERTAFSTDFGNNWISRDTTLAANSHVFYNPEIGWTANVTAAGAGPALYKWTGGSLDDRIYVNKAATGANTGASWADAYTDLKTALAAAQAGDEIWVAEGTYKPAAPGGNQTATFLIDKDLKLYGGFAGTECNLSERDIALHPTVLSGDLNGDDVADDFVTNRDDNVLTVVTVDNDITQETVIDGFTISNGHADGSGANESPDKSGGGFYSTGAPSLSHCIFQQNYAVFQGGGAYFNYNGAQELEVSACYFLKNNAVRGGGLNIVNSNCRVSDCTFNDNLALEHGGGMRYSNTTGGQSITVVDCIFKDNQSSFGGGLRLQTLGDGNNIFVSDCDFTGNAATPLQTSFGQGGGGCNIVLFPNFKDNRISLKNNRYHNNTSSGDAAGCMMGNASNNSTIEVDSCMFLQNRATNNGSGFWISCTGKSMDFQMNACHFIENIAENASAAADFWGNSGGTGTILVDSCRFEGNVSLWSGAVEMGNGNGGTGTQVNYRLSNSEFKNNRATEGGAVGLWCDAVSKVNFVLDNCIIDSNVATIVGGGLAINPSSKDFKAKISRTKIIHNQSLGNGGAFSIYHFFSGLPFPTSASCSFENCLIAGNTSNIATIASDSMPRLDFLNCTIANNTGNGIQLSDQSGLTLQNTILYNPGFAEYTAKTNDVTVTSLGGNLTGDGSLGSHALSYDLQNTDPLFAAPGDYHLAGNSPAIDMGVDPGTLPALDLDGNARVSVNGCVDIGAYESAVVVSTACVVGSHEAGAIGRLQVSPNPAVDFLILQLSGAADAAADVQVFDVQGRMLMQRTLSEGQAMDVRGLAPGMYALRVMQGGRAYAGRFVKL